MTDIARHKRNVRKMIDAGAPEADIDAYLASEGVTADMLRGQSERPADIPEYGSPEYQQRRQQLQSELQQREAAADQAQGRVDGLNRVLNVALPAMNFTDGLLLSAPRRVAFGAADDERRTPLNRAEAERPITTTGAKIAGTVAGVGKLAKAGGTAMRFVDDAARGLPKLAQTTGALAVDGAVLGGVEAAIDGRDVRKATQEGGAMGAAANVVTRGAGSAFRPLLERAKKGVTTRQLQGLRDTAYRRVDQIGATYSEDAARSLKTSLVDDLTIPSVGLNKTDHPATHRMLKLLSKEQGEIGFQKLEQYRKRAARIAAKSNNSEDAYAASIMRDNIDEFVSRIDPTPQAGVSAAEVKQVIDDARGLHRRYRGALSVEEAADKAGRRAASTGRGGNLDNATRQNIRQIMDNPKRIAFFTPEERAAMERVVRDSAGQKVARMVGMAAPRGIVSSGIGGAIGGSVGGPVGAGAVWAAGETGQRLNERMTQKAVEDLLYLIRNGEAATREATRASRIVGNEAVQESVARAAIGTSLATQP
jgi:hypothetical protein